MKKKVYNIVYAVAAILTALAMGACAEDVARQKAQEVLVPFSLAAEGAPAITRTDVNIQGDHFEPGRNINVYVTATGSTDGETTPTDGSTYTSNPLVYTTQAADENGVSKLTPPDNKKLYYPLGDEVRVDIYGLYPPRALDILNKFEVDEEQTTNAAYENNDLMHATVTNHAKSSDVIHLQFTHKMAKVIFNVTGEDGVKIKQIRFTGIKKTIGFTPNTGALTDLEGDATNIIVANSETAVTELNGVALIPPQTIGGETTVRFVEVDVEYSGTETTNQTTAVFYIDRKTFNSGSQYTVNLFIGPKNIYTGNPETDRKGDVYVTNWDDAIGTLTVAAVGSSGLKIEEVYLCDFDGEGKNNPETGNKHHVFTSLDADHVNQGKTHTPKAKVTDGKENNASTLSEGTDYTLSYYNNENAGTALIVATGIGEYAGMTAVEPFIIERAVSTQHYEHAGTEAEPYTVTLAKNQIVDNSIINKGNGNFTFTSSEPTVASIDPVTGDVTMLKKGTTHIIAQMDAQGNFEAQELDYWLKIDAGDASTALRIVLSQDEWTYTGSAIEPSFDVFDGSYQLVNGIDFTYEDGSTSWYRNNTNANLETDANGLPRIVIKGINEYSGTKSQTFTINPATTVLTAAREQKIISSVSGTDNTGTTRGETSFQAFTTNFGEISCTYSEASKVTVSTTGLATSQAVSTGWVTVNASVAENRNWSAATASMQIKVEEMYKKFSYSGAMTSFTLPNTKKALVYGECIGGAGGNDGTDTQPGVGGYGGYVKAHRDYEAGTAVTLYICVGGGGIHATGTGAGWNGGGLPGLIGASGGGGGATDFSTSGTAYDNATHIANRVLVAGGGGGSSNIGGSGTSGAPIGTAEVGDYTGNWRGEDNTVGTVDGGGGGAGYVGGVKGIESAGTVTGGHGGSNFIHSDWTQDTNSTSTNGGWHGTGTNVGYTGSGQHGWAYIWYTYYDN